MGKLPRLAIAVHAADHVQGGDTARVTLVEYGDYQCPYCAAAHPLVKQLQRHFGSELRFVFRNFPLMQAHPLALAAAQLAEAAATLGQFWPMHDWLFEHQRRWSAQGLESMTAAIAALGLDENAVQRALAREQIAARIQADFDGGLRSGVQGTPGFFIDGEMHLGGPRTLARAVERRLAGG